MGCSRIATRHSDLLEQGQIADAQLVIIYNLAVALLAVRSA
jgi:hypothetical protein